MQEERAPVRGVNDYGPPKPAPRPMPQAERNRLMKDEYDDVFGPAEDEEASR